MFSALIQLALQNLIYLALHLENNGSFPKKLSKEEEQCCLEEIAKGNLKARNKLIEHNLRLVAYKKSIIALNPPVNATFSMRNGARNCKNAVFCYTLFGTKDNLSEKATQS